MICNIEAQPSGNKVVNLDHTLSSQHLARLLDDARSGIVDASARTGDASLPLKLPDLVHTRKDLIGRHEVGVVATSMRSSNQHGFNFIHNIRWPNHQTNGNTATIRSQAAFFSVTSRAR